MKAGSRALTSDELGERGEVRFRDLCLDAHLVCNKADRDRCGWDFIVEFPHAEAPFRSLDHRVTPLSCLVQVKAIYDTAKAVKLRLSAAERLAKELKPTFVYVLRFDHSAQLADTYLIHLSGERLAEILRRLREESAKGTAKERINKKYITLSVTDCEAIPSTGQDFAQAVKDCCASGMAAYAGAKELELRTLGFNQASLEFSFQIPGISDYEMIDVLLGIKKEIRATQVRAIEHRFGIAIPQENFDEVLLSIEPESIDTCVVSFSNDHIHTRFKCHIFAPGVPSLPPHLARVKIECEDVTLVFNFYKHDVDITLDSTRNRTISAWQRIFLMWEILNSDRACISVTATEKAIDFKLPLKVKNRPDASQEARLLKRFADRAERVFEMANIAEETEVSYEAIISTAQAFSALLNDEGPPEKALTITGTAIFPDHLEAGGRFGLAYAIAFDNMTLAFFSVGDFKAHRELDRWTFSTSNLCPRTVYRLRGNNPKELQEFAAKEETKSGLTTSLRIDGTGKTPSVLQYQSAN